MKNDRVIDQTSLSLDQSSVSSRATADTLTTGELTHRSSCGQAYQFSIDSDMPLGSVGHINFEEDRNTRPSEHPSVRAP